MMGEDAADAGRPGNGVVKVSISTKLILSFLLVIALGSAVFIIVGVQLIGDRIVAEAQEQVRHDLNTAREIYTSRLLQVNNVIRFTAERFFLKDALLSNNLQHIAEELVKVKRNEGLDILTVTDQTGRVLQRSNSSTLVGDDHNTDPLVMEVLSQREPIAVTAIVSAVELRKESQGLADKACCEVIDTPRARESEMQELNDGMMLKAAAPILDYQGNLIGVLHGGVLLNNNNTLVDKIKETVFEGLEYKGKDIGTATIFQDDVRVSTNVRNEDGTRAIGTRVSEEVYNHVFLEGEPWIGRAYVVNDWYITAYEPIRDIDQEIIGILYVGLLEEKYRDIRNETIVAFLAISLMVGAGSMMLSYIISNRVSVPIEKLASASKEIADGNLDTKVVFNSNDELGELAHSFNAMASALRQRDAQLKELAARKVMESERLALIGQLAANVAHELNNPLQGIVTYSHLLLEKSPDDSPTSSSVEKIATQASRCKDIIRGLLDFSRQRKPDKTICSLDSVLQECISFVENQAPFQNIGIKTFFDENLPKIVVDPSQIQQVLMNMIINAAEAMENGGELTLETKFDSAENHVEVAVTDTGHGIPEEVRDKIFDPFFTTKEVGQGTGLGLAISYGIIKEHGGTISVESEVGKGTTFVIRLPLRKLEEVEPDGR